MSAPTIVPIALNLIDDDPKNPRGDAGDVSDLKLTIATDGLQDPLQLIPTGTGRYRLHEGHRRRKALAELGERTAPAVLRRFGTDLDRVVSQGVMHAHAVDWDPMAWSRYLYRLFSEFNLGREQIAHRLGRSPAWVRDTMSFVHLKEFEQRELAARRMTRAEALRRLANRRAVRDNKPQPAARPAAPKLPQQRRAARPVAEPNLNPEHRLAEQVAICCASGGLQHAAHPKIGEVGCGFCWELVIVNDAFQKATRRTLVQVA